MLQDGVAVGKTLGDRRKLVLDLDEGVDHVGVELGGALLEDQLHRLVVGHPRPVDAVAGQGIEHVGDRDLWRFAHPHTSAFCAGLSAKTKDFGTWQWIAINEAAYLETIAAGQAILGFQQGQIDKAAQGDLRKIAINGQLGLASNVTNNVSEVGNAIAKRSGTYSLTFFIKDTDAICSLRSIAPYDCTPLAKHYGGGGHAQACGFKLPVGRFFSEVWGA